MTNREHIQTLLTVARRYWLEQVTQAEIAAEIGYSRSMVSRLLDEARRRGIITFTVQHPLERAIELEDDLTRTFGLACARVALSSNDSATDEVSRMAADLVRTYMHPDSVIALSNGRRGSLGGTCHGADTLSGSNGGASDWWNGTREPVVGLPRAVPPDGRANWLRLPSDARTGAGVESTGGGSIKGRDVGWNDDRDGLPRRHPGDGCGRGRGELSSADFRPHDARTGSRRVVVAGSSRPHLRTPH